MKPMNRNRHPSLTEGAIGKTLLRLSVPMMMGFIAMVIFNTADTIYVGRLGGSELAALSFTFPVAMFFIAIAQGIGVGVASVVSRKIGAGDFQSSQRVTTHTLILALLTSITISAVGLLTIDPLFRALGAGDDLLPLIRDYMEIWYIGIIFVMVPMTGNNVIRATGDAKTPMFIMLTAAILNIVLDPFFIFGIGPFPEMKLAGAALTTVFSRGTTMVVTLYILTKREGLIELKKPVVRELKKSWSEVLHIGAPASLTNLLMPFSMGFLTYLCSLYGKEAVAAFGVGTRIDFIALLPVMGLSASLIPFVGQNTGAGERQRIKEAVGISLRFSLLWGLGIAVFLAALSNYIGLAFTTNEGILEHFQLYLLIIPWGYAFVGVITLVSGYYNASGRPLPAALLLSMRYLILLVPLALSLSSLFGYSGVLLGIALSGFFTGITGVFIVRRSMK